MNHHLGSLSDGGNTMLSLPIQLVQLHDPGGEGEDGRGSGGMSGSQAFNGHIIIKNDPDGTRTFLLDPSEVGISCCFQFQFVVLVSSCLILALFFLFLVYNKTFLFFTDFEINPQPTRKNWYDGYIIWIISNVVSAFTLCASFQLISPFSSQ